MADQQSITAWMGKHCRIECRDPGTEGCECWQALQTASAGGVSLQNTPAARLVSRLRSLNLGTAAGRGTAMVALADAADMIEQQSRLLRDVVAMIERGKA